MMACKLQGHLKKIKHIIWIHNKNLPFNVKFSDNISEYLIYILYQCVIVVEWSQPFCERLLIILIKNITVLKA